MESMDTVVRGVNENDFSSFFQQNVNRLYAVFDSLFQEWNENQGVSNRPTIQQGDIHNPVVPNLTSQFTSIDTESIPERSICTTNGEPSTKRRKSNGQFNEQNGSQRMGRSKIHQVESDRQLRNVGKEVKTKKTVSWDTEIELNDEANMSTDIGLHNKKLLSLRLDLRRADEESSGTQICRWTGAQWLKFKEALDKPIDEDDKMPYRQRMQQLNWKMIGSKMNKTAEECQQELNSQIKIECSSKTLIEVLRTVDMPAENLIDVYDERRKNKMFKKFITAETVHWVN